MKKLLLPFLILSMVFSSIGATIVVKISQFPNTTAPAGGDLFLLASGATNKNITWNQLKDAIGTNPATVTILNNLYVSNAFFTNLTVLNEFHGKTSFITNLYLVNANTNFYLFNTNIYTSDTTVSNYFTTNVFNNSYVSNFFNTNVYVTNFPTSYITVTNFYQTDEYVSNFFNTNIFVNNSYVSNYFVTNIFPTYTISSNFTYNVAWPLTNATLYGTTTFSPVSGTVPGRISLLLGGVEAVSLVASNSSMTANTVFFRTNAWLGPTNAIDLNVEDQGYASFTACSITGLLNRSNTVVQSVMLTLTNKSSTNWLLTIPSGWIPERTNQVAISNASQGMLSIRYHPAFGTNAVYRQF